MARDPSNPVDMTFAELCRWVEEAAVADVLAYLEAFLRRAFCDAAIDTVAQLLGRLHDRLVKEEESRR